MLKYAFRFIGIGFFLAGVLLLGLYYSGNIPQNFTRSAQNEHTTFRAQTSTAQDETSETTQLAASSATENTETTGTVVTSSTSVLSSATQESSTQSSSQSTSSEQRTLQFRVNNGDNSYTIAQQLQQAGVISDVNSFINYLTTSNLDRLIQNGQFSIPSNASFEELGKILTTYPGN